MGGGDTGEASSAELKTVDKPAPYHSPCTLLFGGQGHPIQSSHPDSCSSLFSYTSIYHEDPLVPATLSTLKHFTASLRNYYLSIPPSPPPPPSPTLVVQHKFARLTQLVKWCLHILVDSSRSRLRGWFCETNMHRPIACTSAGGSQSWAVFPSYIWLPALH